MGKRDPRIDVYIAQAAPFARPILEHLRGLVHTACPEVQETLKWSAPFFDYKGILCGMAAFKEHCSFNLWKGSLVLKQDSNGPKEGMGQFGRITALTDLPDDGLLLGYIKEAARLNEEGVKVQAKAKPKKPKELIIPDYFKAALRKNKKAQAEFDKFSYSHRKEYLEWITEAKTEETRQRRIATTLEWLAEGKPRHWKYEK
jgi:uncharacterized protein YdeI (YjbR/CyaY-like superfamily)